MLNGKVVAVTGAGRGIGREVALLCARYGAAVVVNDYGGTTAEEAAASPAQDVVAEITGFGGSAIANFADIANPTQAASIVEDGVKAFGRIDAVVNSAGILRDRMFHNMSHKEWKDVIDVHLNGYFNVSRAAATYFKQQQSGSLVHFTSTTGLIGNYGQANYAAAKLGIVAMSKSIALDMQRYNVRSNAIAPFAWSRMIASIPTETEEEKLRVERLKTMSADKIAPLVVFLCSDASKDVSGQIFAVRKNEIFLYQPMKIVRSMHRSEGWTPETIASDLYPAFTPSFAKLDRSADIFSWDPA